MYEPTDTSSPAKNPDATPSSTLNAIQPAHHKPNSAGVGASHQRSPPALASDVPPRPDLWDRRLGPAH